MIVKFIEAMHPGGTGNWGKFFVGRFSQEEWSYKSSVSPQFGSLLTQRGWTKDHIIVFDVQTGEGGIFRPGGLAKADLEKHKLWVCPLFEPFLVWLYQQDLTDLHSLPDTVEISHDEQEFQFSGHRRGGPRYRVRIFRHHTFEDINSTVAVFKNLTTLEVAGVVSKYMPGEGVKIVVEDEDSWRRAEEDAANE